VWVGVPHATESRIVDVWSANRSNGASLLELLPHSPSSRPGTGSMLCN